MIFREAELTDIPQMMEVRMSVRENVLSDPTRIPYSEYVKFLCERGKGWIAEKIGIVTGFAIVDLIGSNIWALFVRPEFEKMGVGLKLHQLMMDWYFKQASNVVWLSTAPKSRAESFYKKAGWKEVGIHGEGETKFEMRLEDWHK